MENDAPDAQKLHDRAERSGNEARKTILSLSSGGVAVLFVALTGRVEPNLGLYERIVVITGAVMFGASVLVGIALWKLDARRSYWRARAIKARDKDTKTNYFNKCMKYGTIKRRLNAVQPVAFAFGTIAITIYTVFRANR